MTDYGIAKDVLEKAAEIVSVGRDAKHGAPERNLRRIAVFWSVYLGIEVAPHDVAAMMVLFKMARARANPALEDNWVDAAGYAALGMGLFKMAQAVGEAPE